MIRPTVLVDGAVAGTWSIRRSAAALRCTVRPFATFTRARLREVEAEVADLGRFYGRPACLAAVQPW